MKELKIGKSGFSESQSYPVLKGNFLKTLGSTLTPSEKREALEGFKEGFIAAQKLMPDWYEGMPPFLDPEYRIHPLMGHQVRSRHVFIPEGKTQEQRLADKKSVGFRQPFVQGVDVEPLEPIKMRKGTKLVLEDRINTFEAVVASYKTKGKLNKIPLVLTPGGYIYASSSSAAMKKKMIVLELTFDTDGHLYSPKTFNEGWEWQSKAIWLRSIGMGHRAISQRINKSVNSIKSMFLRLKISEFFKSYSSIDWATTGYGRTLGETPSGWRAVLHGGSSGMLYPADQGEGYEARETIGEMTGAHREGLLETERVTLDRLQKNIKRFNFDKHKKEVILRGKQEKKHKKQVIKEQKSMGVSALKRNILNGFNLKTGKYKEDNDE